MTKKKPPRRATPLKARSRVDALIDAFPDERYLELLDEMKPRQKRDVVLDEWQRKMDDLIDAFPNDRFLELLAELIDRAQVARAARIEETGVDPDEDPTA